eukprot:TRINITY_DN8112_c0_g1_i3.p1 TRINITY_DN8112_c0_g1~~TRINITY_DN8112_c0_g1_i3.p1  ORF type:complete len:525 (-),score=110.13 TRINITY_DN8112_c0_g1_i3:162-1736(-)
MEQELEAYKTSRVVSSTIRYQEEGLNNNEFPVSKPLVKAKRHNTGPNKSLSELLGKTAQETRENLVKMKLTVLNNNELGLMRLTETTEQNNVTRELTSYRTEYEHEVEESVISSHRIFEENYDEEQRSLEIVGVINSQLIDLTFYDLQEVLTLLASDRATFLKEVKKSSENKNKALKMYAALAFFELKEQCESLANMILITNNIKSTFYLLLLGILHNDKALIKKCYMILRRYYLWSIDEPEDVEEYEIMKALKISQQFHDVMIDGEMVIINDGHSILQVEQRSLYQALRELRNELNKTYLIPNQQYDLCRIVRKKTFDPMEDEEVYPHHFTLRRDHDGRELAYAFRESIYGTILIFSKRVEKNLSTFNEYYLGKIQPNYWGTEFVIYDNGLEASNLSKLPSFLFTERKQIGRIIYETNVMGQQPRFFSCEIQDFLDNKLKTMKNVRPDYNPKKECYQLNFYGRARLASARNFQMVIPDDPDSILLMHGKNATNEFALDYRHPFNLIQAFSISLVSIGKKFLVS